MLVADSSISLYEQLKLLIKNDIINKVYKPGEKAVHLSNFVALSSRITYAITVEDNSCDIKVI